VRHFRQVIPNTGCRKQQPYWAGLSALDPEQDASVSAPLLPAADFFRFPVFPKLPSRKWAVLPLRKKSAGIHPRSPSKAWLSSGCTGFAPLHNRMAAGTQRASPLSIAAVHHRDAGTGCTRPRPSQQAVR